MHADVQQPISNAQRTEANILIQFFTRISAYNLLPVLQMGGTNFHCIRLSRTYVIRATLWIPQLRDHQGSGLQGLSGIIRGNGSANESRSFTVTASLIGWAHTQNDPYSCELMVKWRHADTEIDIITIEYH